MPHPTTRIRIMRALLGSRGATPAQVRSRAGLRMNQAEMAFRKMIALGWAERFADEHGARWRLTVEGRRALRSGVAERSFGRELPPTAGDAA